MAGIGLTLRRSLLLNVPAWSVFVSEASADCQPGTPTSGQTIGCSGTSTGFVAPAAATGLTAGESRYLKVTCERRHADLRHLRRAGYAAAIVLVHRDAI